MSKDNQAMLTAWKNFKSRVSTVVKSAWIVTVLLAGGILWAITGSVPLAAWALLLYPFVCYVLSLHDTIGALRERVTILKGEAAGQKVDPAQEKLEQLDVFDIFTQLQKDLRRLRADSNVRNTFGIPSELYFAKNG